MEAVTILRFLLPIMGIGIFALAARLIGPPERIVLLALKLCWITGAANLFWDVIGTRCRLWHFTMNHVLFGLPLDLYVTVSLVYGGALLLVYWWVQTNYPRCTSLFVAVLPFYGLLRDYVGQKMTGSVFLVWDTPYWWIPDFVAWATGLWSLIFVFNKLAEPESRP